MEKLAIYGGPKVRTEPFPERTPFGEREEGTAASGGA